MYQGPQALDSVLNFPLYSALLGAFQIPGPADITTLVNVFEDSKKKFTVSIQNIRAVRPSF